MFSDFRAEFRANRSLNGTQLRSSVPGFVINVFARLDAVLHPSVENQEECARPVIDCRDSQLVATKYQCVGR